MDNQNQTRGKALVRRWEQRLKNAGLDGLAGVLREGLRPLGPLAAQVLWLSQPGFALFGQSEVIGSLANSLNGDSDDLNPDSHLHTDNEP